MEIPKGASLSQILRLVANEVEDIPGTGGPEPNIIAKYNADRSQVILGYSGHVVPAALAGEGIFTYFIRIAGSINGNPNAAGGIQMNADYYNVGKTGDPILDLAVQADAYANPHNYGLGGAAPPGSGGSPTVVESPTYTNGRAEEVLSQGISRAFHIPEKGSIALEVDLKAGSFRVGAGEYQSSPSRYALSLSRTPHAYEGQPIYTQGTSPSGICTIGAWEPFTPGKWYINVSLLQVGKEGDAGESFIVSFYQQ